MMESELGVSAAAALAAPIHPEPYMTSTRLWSLPGSDGGSPYQGGRFVLDPSPGSTHAARRVIPESLSWSSAHTGSEAVEQAA